MIVELKLISTTIPKIKLIKKVNDVSQSPETCSDIFVVIVIIHNYYIILLVKIQIHIKVQQYYY